MFQSKVPGGNELLDPQKVLTAVGVIQGLKIGDFGCGGRGFFSLQAARMVGQDGVVYAIDILKPVLKSVENEAHSLGLYNLKTVWSDLEKKDATKIKTELDIALVINLLFQVEKNENVIYEVKRLLKTQGKLLIIDWKQTGALFGPPVEKRVDIEQIKNLVIKIGFELQEEFEAGSFHFGLIFIKK
ncbi:MAG: methyltransferase domain-containing protein [Patescibacteria group bacterium]|jgi:2-polyprenyl-3-methyl-5-hydroxy-6-metoxy-1,4-benzoquinol methylase|nr:methyltransferase domain-containing protein [Patescibacteria group bacterium]